MSYLLKQKKIKKQLFFLRTNLLTFKKKKLKPQLGLLSNKFIGSCSRIKFVANNIYCTFWSISGKRTFRVRSAGMKKIKISKRRLLLYGKAFLDSFFQELQQWRQKYKQKKADFFFSIIAPKRFRKIILKNILGKATAINFEYKKAFNGCKVKKKRRKKRLGFRSFK